MAIDIRENLPVTLSSSLGARVEVVSAVVDETISQCFLIEVELRTEDGDTDLAGLIGGTATLKDSRSSPARIFSGVVTRAVYAGMEGDLHQFRLQIRPKLWTAAFKMDAKTYQAKSVKDIAEAALRAAGVTDFKFSLTGTYSPRDYCVQYNESTLAFVSRLFEDAGISFYFKHGDGTHTMTIVDDASGFAAIAGPVETVVLGPAVDTSMGNVVTSATLERQIRHDTAKVDDYNFETSTSDLKASAGQTTNYPYFEYPAGYGVAADGPAVARRRVEEAGADALVLRGNATHTHMGAGVHFTLAEHPRADANVAWVVRSASHTITQDKHEVAFDAFPKSVPYRPPRVTPRPRIWGTQTAQVTGPSGEEIFTDAHGRIKVKFHWDAYAKPDDTSSFWVRVSQPWAGLGYGAVNIPRVGNEVVIAFLDGDPDRPLCIGSVYNAQQVPPYTLPANATQSGVKTRTSPSGDGKFNELRFEDKGDAEQIVMHAQKDLLVTVLNDETRTVKKNRTTTLEEGNDTLTLSKGNRVATVDNGGDTALGADTLTVKGKRTITVSEDEAHTNEKKYTHTVTGDFTLKVTGNVSIETDGTFTIKAAGATKVESDADVGLKGVNVKAEASADIGLKGANVKGEASASLELKGGASGKVDGGGMLELKGGMVKVN